MTSSDYSSADSLSAESPRPDFDELTGGFSDEFGCEEVTAAEFLKRVRHNAALLLIDIRTREEQSVSTIAGALRLQPGDAPGRTAEYRAFRANFGAEGDCIFFCTGGKRSAIAAAEAKAMHPGERFLNLRGGLIAYANLGGELTRPDSGERTSELHGYNEKWASYIEAPARAVLEPAIPEPK